jgi:hypothetical protein
MAQDTEWTTFFDAFFVDHPEWLGSVKYLCPPGSDRPEMCMPAPAIRAFLLWVQAHPFSRIGHPERLASTMAARQRLERQDT